MYIEDELGWEVSGILQHKRLGEKSKYLVAYSGYGELKAGWFPESEIRNVLEILND